MCAERYLLSKQIKNFVPLKKSIHKYTVSIYFHKIFLQLGQQESMVNIFAEFWKNYPIFTYQKEGGNIQIHIIHIY